MTSPQVRVGLPGFEKLAAGENNPSSFAAPAWPPAVPGREPTPCEQLWDIVKDDIGNRIFETIEALREVMLPTLQRYWNDAAAVLKLIGREWMPYQSNDLSRSQVSL